MRARVKIIKGGTVLNFEQITKEINEIYEDIVRFRRELHKIPELSGKERETSRKVAEKLKDLPLTIRENVGGNGILAELTGGKPGRTILLRADMDALPIAEDTGLAYSSEHPGAMHACGHDMHTAMLTGIATVLSKHKEELAGTVKFMFQPAEELSPTGGSRAMMEAGILENPKVDEAYAMHVFGVPTGTIAFRPGVANSRSDRIEIVITGKSAHGSLPNEGADAIVAAAGVVTTLQSIISRNLGPSENAVITIGKINGGDRYNVIPDKVILEGTVRTFSDEVVNRIKSRLGNIVKDIAAAHGCAGELHYYDGYDFIWNDPDLSQKLIGSLTPLLGKENIRIQEFPLPTGEDFSFVTKKVPSVFFWIGTECAANKGKCILHNAKFTPDEETIRTGMNIMCKLVCDRMSL